MPAPNGTSNADRFPNVDLPATSDASADVAGMRYIDEAYDEMLADDVEGGPVEPTQPQQPSAPAAPQYPQPVTPQPRVAPPARQPQLQQPTPQLQPQAPQQLATPEQQVETRARQRAESDPFGVQAELLENQQAQYVEALAKQVYQITPEEMDAFLSGDSTKVSQALARVHVNAVGSVMRMVSQQMPVWVSHMLKIRDVAQEAENGFWEANPGLDKKQHKEAALQIARAFRQMNPQASTEEVYRSVGAMVASMFNVNAQSPQQLGGPLQPRTPGRVVRRVPGAFQPAGTQPSSGPSPKIDNPWSMATETLLADEAGMLDNVR